MARTTEKLPVAEAVLSFTAPERIDEAAAVLHGVCILGPESANGGRYPEGVMTDAQKRRLYDGIGVYVDVGDHQKVVNSPPVREKIGDLANVQVRGGKTYADLHYNPEHAFAKQFVWAAKHRPNFYGLSHRTMVQWRPNPDGTRTAESIRKVFGVDIVSEPATTAGVFESKGSKVENDPRMIGATLTSPDALGTFLAGLFDALPSGSFTPEAKLAALQTLLEKYGPAMPADATAEPAMESLRRFGPVGRAAATVLGQYVAESRKADRLKRAAALCETKGLPAHLRTETFLGVVAESIDQTATAEALIADRLAVGKPAGTGATGAPQTTTPAAATPPAKASVKDLVAGYARG